MRRGALIVLEGCDRSGKSTQAKLLVERLVAAGRKSKYLNFPDRKTETGALINSFLTKAQEFNHETIHLLFSLNRWEAKNHMEEMLNSGTTLIVDRYSYSGIAYSTAKGLDFEWCKSPEKGLLKPDLVLYLNLPYDVMAARGGFGNERYEIPELQKNVMQQFERLYESDYWTKVDANKTQEDLCNHLYEIVDKTIKTNENNAINLLWKS